MRLRSLVLAFALCSICLIAPAETFTLSFTDDLSSNALLLLASPTGTSGQFLVTGASGTIDGLTATLLAPGTFPSDDSPNDNMLYFPGTPSYLDLNGIGFELGTTAYYNIYSFLDTYNAARGSTATTSDAGATFIGLSNLSLAPAPEPPAVLLLATGLAALGVLSQNRLRVRPSTVRRRG